MQGFFVSTGCPDISCTSRGDRRSGRTAGWDCSRECGAAVGSGNVRGDLEGAQRARVFRTECTTVSVCAGGGVFRLGNGGSRVISLDGPLFEAGDRGRAKSEELRQVLQSNRIQKGPAESPRRYTCLLPACGRLEPSTRLRCDWRRRVYHAVGPSGRAITKSRRRAGLRRRTGRRAATRYESAWGRDRNVG